eukprot:m.96202 g.96202  ORF g.96202 m.96202 type:complete len:97 (+) comp12356_c0_seq3:780-1070(+)
MSYLSLRLFSPELYAAATSEPAVVANRKMKDAMEKSDCDPAEALQYAVSRGDMRAVENILKAKVDIAKFDYVPPRPADEFYAPKSDSDDESPKKKK